MKTLAEHLGVADPRQPEAPVEEKSFDDMSDRDFCRGVLASKTYRESLLRRVYIDELPAAVEVMLWNRAYGPVPERVEMTTNEKPVEQWTEEEIEARLLYLINESRRKRMNETDKEKSNSHSSVH